ncbi:MAG: response regulator transcription factor [Sphingobacteriales bacterium]|nr:response regulator transcription factor [Sphingobacteriales bacterium]MBI3719381.1 response regulator transcription factor [Sphingobacteriales bacterium]
MIKAIIVDDEPRNIRILKNLLEEFCPDVIVGGEAESAETAINVIRSSHPDIVFLDIEMPFGNAFDLLDKLIPVNFQVIFVTAFDNYALKAFRYYALDYLLKPVDIEELKAAVKKAVERVKEKNMSQTLDVFIQTMKPSKNTLQKIGLPTNDGLVFTNIEDIVRCEASGSYTIIYLHDKQKFIVSKSLKEYEDLLPEDNFCRIHHSHIVNLAYVKKYFKGRGGYIEMNDNTTIEVATRKRDEFLAKFEQ